ncbi:hypothetical protein EVA_12183 [gut metagenome]|uniref:Uncharacterized protein n=1 Tax=gut metagenome TaxID=749906 RepID=J9CI33_9ZZZZ
MVYENSTRKRIKAWFSHWYRHWHRYRRTPRRPLYRNRPLAYFQLNIKQQRHRSLCKL